MQSNDAFPYEIGTGFGELAEQLSIEEFRDLFDRHGAILFRDVATSSDDFLTISSRYGKAWVPYQFGGRDTVSKTASLQTVNTGKTAIVAHSEMSHMPMHPHMAWFYCDKPPRELGATTLFDGAVLVDTMPERLKRVLEGRRFRYRRRQALSLALKVYGVDTADDLRRMIDQAGWDEWLRVEDGSLYQDYTVPTFPVHAATGRPVFANMLVHNSRLRRFYGMFYEWFSRNRLLRPLFDPFVAVFDRLPERFSRVPHPFGVALYPTFENGEIVPRRVIRELQAHYVEHEIAVPWKAGDIVVIDNWRLMHGRQAVADEDRRILTRFGFPHWDEPAHEFGGH